MTLHPRGFIVAGTQSGVGKTTIATGLMAALVARGLVVQPFKAGPDYIDPSYHTVVCGRPSRNLDGWLVGKAPTTELFRRAAAAADVSVVEGVMGLYDGRSGGGEAGSTAELAKLIGLPVVLVVDAGSMARSAAAMALGYQAFDPGVAIAGVIVNRVASARHGETVRLAIEDEAGLSVLGMLPTEPALRLPERYLGLVPVVEGTVAEAFFAAACRIIQENVDLDRLLALAAPIDTSAPAQGERSLFPDTPCAPRARIAVAMDQAFSFYYADGLDLLRAWGAELLPFSPLVDDDLPADVGAVYLGGGFPELFAQRLAANTSMLRALRCAAERGVVIYGECGGFMYLGQSLTDTAGVCHQMAGLLPLRSTMTNSRLTLAYWDLVTRQDGPLAPAGARLRGHEFHWSVAHGAPDPADALYALEGSDRLEGMRRGAAFGSYVHLHLGSDRSLAPRFVQLAAEAGR